MRLMLVGKNGVGKSALALRLVRPDEFEENWDPMIADDYPTTLDVGGRSYDITVSDTAGELGEYDCVIGQQQVTERLIVAAHAFLLVYDITDRASLESLRAQRNEIINLISTSGEASSRPVPPMVLVGTKLDLQTERAVQPAEASEFARSLVNCVACFETSAKTPAHIEEPFRALVEELLRREEVAGRERAAARTKRKSCVIL